ncbi:MAG: hypothetical protein PHV80_04285 [Rugosibacter sp.]|nr:hypothetical protein [Rugosibacter sp.]
MDFYRSNIQECNDIADGYAIPKFSALYRRDLAKYGFDPQAVDLLEAVTRVGNFNNTARYQAERKNRARLLFTTNGEKQRRGKRTRPGMLEFVAELTPKLLFYGVPFKTGGRSRLVTVLQIIASEIGLDGDPRDELRRLKKLDLSQRAAMRARFYEILADGIRPRPRVAS